MTSLTLEQTPSTSFLEKQLSQKLKNKEAQIAILGLGYVGLPLAIGIAESGFNVTGFDVSQSKIDSIARGISYIEDVDSSRISNPHFKATTEANDLNNADVYVICVPTPLNAFHEPNVDYIVSAMNALLPTLKTGNLVILESTTYPGTTTDLISNVLASKGLIVGEDVFVGYSPERVDPRNANYTLHNTAKVVSGETPACLALVDAFYGAFIDTTVPVSSTRVAEFTKLYENTFRSVNIALVNEMTMLAEALEIPIYEALTAAHTKPYGIMPFYPGPGVGGHCIPIDPLYLNWKLKEKGMQSRFIHLADDINGAMPHYVVSRIAEILNEQQKSLKGSTITLLGMSYKANVGDWRESPSLHVANALRAKGANLNLVDPHVQHCIMEDGTTLVCDTQIDVENVDSADVIVLLTNHRAFNYSLLDVPNTPPVLNCQKPMARLSNQVLL